MRTKNEKQKIKETRDMGQIHISEDIELEATTSDGEKISVTLRGGRNHPVCKLIRLDCGKYDAVLSSGTTVHNIDLDNLGRKLGDIDVEGASAPESTSEPEQTADAEEPQESEKKKSWFEGFGGQG